MLILFQTHVQGVSKNIHLFFNYKSYTMACDANTTLEKFADSSSSINNQSCNEGKSA